MTVLDLGAWEEEEAEEDEEDGEGFNLRESCCSKSEDSSPPSPPPPPFLLGRLSKSTSLARENQALGAGSSGAGPRAANIHRQLRARGMARPS
eukprot:CAMPEP_0177737542 /NCGR_PEP_ID=MMETSP0484_2-20121128/25941_1 /TAXON_ID=354590 /ORGANISM="Rhodomonas lens, Strain RHODO" /LENGTH=92 /DNA_ID=CAMNT_0019251331 /DNA_START=100 /DNA_END=379 /DNA_ORIENTATION=-